MSYWIWTTLKGYDCNLHTLFSLTVFYGDGLMSIQHIRPANFAKHLLKHILVLTRKSFDFCSHLLNTYNCSKTTCFAVLGMGLGIHRAQTDLNAIQLSISNYVIKISYYFYAFRYYWDPTLALTYITFLVSFLLVDYDDLFSLV